jgi:hypothetical protein
MRLDPETRQPTAGMLTAADGSWTTIELADQDGIRQVIEAGATALWPAVEAAHQRWIELGEPDWPRLGVTDGPARGLATTLGASRSLGGAEL